MARTVVFEGVWCPRCEFVEVPDMTSDDDDGTCMGCGCPANVHLDVEVVAKAEAKRKELMD